MTASLSYHKEYAFNAICPYYTMFPLEYPLRLIRRHKADASIVLDPFCGRGTTLYAARKLGLTAYGCDSSPIAAAIAQAKLASATIEEVVELGRTLVEKTPKAIPDTPFFKRAFAKNALKQICSLREGLLDEERPTHASAILRAAALGCLHGPLLKGDGIPSYFSNQMPRTFASKPDYSLRFWKKKDLFPPSVDVMDVIEKKLLRISDLDSEAGGRLSNVKCADSRLRSSFRNVGKASLTITSPPYYGMRTYIQDQWLRMWFVGGETEIDYETCDQLSHSSHSAFVTDLAKVWKNVHKHSIRGAHLYVRFGRLPSAKSDAKELMLNSLEEAAGWRLVSVRNASTADAGKRQANQMVRDSEPLEEFDFHAIKA
jgi:hypothetical protein